MLAFLRQYKYWILAPVVLTGLLLALVAYLGASESTPFLYTLF